MILNEKTCKSISKLMSLALRHHPEALQITLDEHGWTDTSSLIQALCKKGFRIGLEELDQVVDTNDKKRFAFNEDKSKIRASQGHSIEVDLELSPVEPPEFLYHGTAVENIDSILKKGIEKRSRQHVHLSKDQETALKVGTRHGKPEVLLIRSAAMHQAGFAFFLSANQVWLTDFVPAEFIERIIDFRV